MKVIHRLDTRNLDSISDEARWAEQMGYDGLSSNETAHDPFFPLLLAATTTSHVALKTHVTIAFPRSPMVVAYTARDLYEYSGGRFYLGLGTQVKGHNERRFSIPWMSPGRRLQEYVLALHAIWESWQDGKKLDFQRQFYTFTLMTPLFNPGPSNYPKQSVWISAINPYNCRVAGEVCDGLAIHRLSSPKYVRDVIVPNVAKGAERAGRDFADIKLSGGGFIVAGPSRRLFGDQIEAVKRSIAFYASTRTYSPTLEVHGFQEVGQRLHKMSIEGDWGRMAGLITQDILDTFAIIGEYDEIPWMIQERFGGILDEVTFNMQVSSADDRQALRGIIKALQS